MRLALFYDPSPGTVGDYFFRAFHALGVPVTHCDTSTADQCRESSDVYLRIDHGDYSSRWPSRLRPSAFYAVDTHLRRSRNAIRRQAGQYDLVFCAQREAARKLPRAWWVPLGCDPDVHRAAPGPRVYDLAFIGNDGGVPRKFYLQELRERYPNSIIGRAPYTDMPTIYSQAKIGFHYIECTSSWRDHVSMRVYEVMASGTMLLANRVEGDAFESLGMRDRNELVLYRNPQELFDLIEHFLHHDEERERIAANGQRLVITQHTYQHRAARIVELLQQEILT